MLYQKRPFKSRFVIQPMCLLVLIAGSTYAQQRPSSSQSSLSDVISADKGSLQEDRAPLTSFEEELRAKRAIRLAEKEHEQNLKRAREISDLAKELETNSSNLASLDRQTVKKLERIEKLTKKIRGEAGGEEGEISVPNRPNNIQGTIEKISQVAESLSKNVQNTPRQVVSASVIDSANVLLELIKYVRTLTP